MAEQADVMDTDRIPVASWGGGWLGVWLASTAEQGAGTERRLQEFLAKEIASGGVDNPLASGALTAPDQSLLEPATKSPAQTFAKYISTHVMFETLIIIVIVLSSFALAVEGPPEAAYLQNYPAFKSFLEVCDVTFFFIFWGELVVKVIGNGFGFQEGAYLSDGWNRLDFTVVFFTTVDFVLRYLAPGTDAGWARVFRMLRVLRPLRLVSKYDNIRVVIEALIASTSGVLATVVLGFFFNLIFAIVGLNLFSGLFWSCDTGEEYEGEPLSRVACEATGYDWVNADQHFDNVFSAFEVLFICSTLEGWVEVMNMAMDVPDTIGEAPVENNNPWYSIYFVLFLLCNSFFITNLFVGVLVMKFQESTGSSIMTDEQRKWSRFSMTVWMASMTPSEEVEKIDLRTANPVKRCVVTLVVLFYMIIVFGILMHCC